MNKFIKYILFFLAPIILLGGLCEVVLRNIPNSYRYKYEWMSNNAGEVEAIVLGNSHTYYGIRPEFFNSKTFNLANVSQGYYEDYRLLTMFDDKYKNLHTVIMPVSYFSFFSKALGEGSEKYRMKYYNIYMHFNYNGGSVLNYLEIGDIVSARKKMALFLKGKSSSFDKYGWASDYTLNKKQKDGKWEKAEKDVIAHTYKEWAPLQFTYACKIADYCQQHSIRLVLVTTPTWHTYYDLLDERQLKEMYRNIISLQNKYEVEYFDYLKDPRFEAEDFFDVHHLSDRGAVKFTEILLKDIENTKKNGELSNNRTTKIH